MEKSRDDLRVDAVASARELVADEGLAGLTVRRVAERIGCSVGTIYNLFADLDDLIMHVASELIDELHAELFAEPVPQDPFERLSELAQRYIAFAVARPRLWSMLFEYGTDKPSPDWHNARIARLVAAVQAAAAPAFEGTEADVRASVEVLWASVHGITQLALRGKLGFVTTESAAGLAERLVRTYVAGARAIPDRTESSERKGIAPDLKA
jgi:AcrR family transcriptional regulator